MMYYQVSSAAYLDRSQPTLTRDPNPPQTRPTGCIAFWKPTPTQARVGVCRIDKINLFLTRKSKAKLYKYMTSIGCHDDKSESMTHLQGSRLPCDRVGIA
jgi:hypothetical protein